LGGWGVKAPPRWRFWVIPRGLGVIPMGLEVKVPPLGIVVTGKKSFHE